MREYTTLQVVWFVLISILWVGYFVLEGFDFGVGMLVRRLGHTDPERRAIIHAIGPVWDGNEVWLVVAGGATFAAFPIWYATLFSGFYLALFLILAGLIVRGVAFEFWGKRPEPRWRATWEWALVIGSAVPALLWGVAWADIVAGVPIDGHQEYTGNLVDLLHPYALLGGVVTLTLFLSHGAIFLTLRTREPVEDRARGVARIVAPVAAVALTGFGVWTLVDQGNRGGVEVVSALAMVAAVGLAATVPVLVRRRPGWAFGLSAGSIALLFVSLASDLFPHVLVSSTSPAFDITLNQASSSHYTLTVMTVVAAILVPVVLLYQGWTYWVFRHRVGPEDFGDVRTPIDLIGRSRSAGG